VQEAAVRAKATQDLQIYADTFEKASARIVTGEKAQAKAATDTADAVHLSMQRQKEDLENLELAWIAAAEGAARMGQTITTHLPSANELLADLIRTTQELDGSLHTLAGTARQTFGGGDAGTGGTPGSEGF